MLSKIACKQLLALPLLWAAFHASALQAQFVNVTFNPVMEVTGQPFTLNVTTPTVSGSLAVGVVVRKGSPPYTELFSTNVTTVNGAVTIEVPAIATPGEYEADISVPYFSGYNASLGFTVFGANQGADVELLGQDVFYFTGQETTAQGGSELVAIAGSFSSDGQGNITSGVLDKNSGTGYTSAKDVTGTYRLNFDGTGTATLKSSAGTYTLAISGQSKAAVPGNYTAYIAATGSTLLHAAGQIGSAEQISSIYPGKYPFRLVGEASPGSVNLFGAGDLTFAGGKTPASVGTAVSAEYQEIVNGVSTNVFGLTGTVTGFDTTLGRFTFTLNASGEAPSSYVAYQMVSIPATNRVFTFLSTDPHNTSPLLVGTVDQR